MRRKFFDHLTAGLFFLAAMPLTAQSQPKVTTEQPRSPIPTAWKGVEARLFEVQRLPGNTLLCSIFFANRPDAKEHAIIAENIRKVIRPGLNGAPPYEDIAYDPYSPATGATLIDEKTGISYKIDEAGNNSLHKSTSESSFTLRPDTGIVMSFVVKCPPIPEVEPGQKPPKQIITIQTPKVKEPFRNIVIPQNEGEVIKFHPN
ncbi:MAG: hypothetical protein RLZZ408_1424 [Verrucomicrobiota bacterium]|jgi:hypothetical protein